MSAPAAPSIPPRPLRTQQAAALQGVDRMPEIPPRPKRMDRSVSPANYPRSPFNEPYNPSLNLSRRISRDDELVRRPSVQQMPSVGQEGMEYGDIQVQAEKPAPATTVGGTHQTRSIDKDLKLHAPKPSLPTVSATAQVQAVTRTDSQQAASHGIGKAETPGPDENEPVKRVGSRASFSRPGSSISVDRRHSGNYEHDVGPAEVGIRVPINPYLGDVQAPSPAPYGLSPHHTGQSDHGRKKSVHGHKPRETHLPPGSYGLHGHGVLPPDKFERDWYAKHPDQLEHEEGRGHGVYENIGSGRGAFAMSSDDLNKIVRESASRGAGFGTSGVVPSYPDEQIGYIASEQYSSRSQTGTPNAGLGLTKTLTNSSQTGQDLALKPTTTAEDDSVAGGVKINRKTSGGHSDSEEPVHINDPKRRFNKVTGGQETMSETADVKPYVTHSGDDEDQLTEHGYSVPILASDESAKTLSVEHHQPAISPRQERRSGQYEYDHKSGEHTPTSRPSSRPGSIYGMHSASHSLSRFISHHDERENLHTPLEDVDEYEPLFPDEDSRKKKEIPTSERFKPRPDALKHRFPSQDIWEDTPSSHLYEATVSTPDLTTADMKSPTFEHPDAEAARKREPSEEEKKKLIPQEERLAKSKFAPHLRDDMPTRPGMVPRFPSRDIWEDSPDSAHLETTVASPPPDESVESPTETMAKPLIPPRPTNKSRLGEDASSNQIAPAIPARPARVVHAVPPANAELTSPTKTVPPSLDTRKAPTIPDRPKPQIPARPAKKPSDASITKTLSRESADGSEGAVAAKDKPSIPPRPTQPTKFASLRGNFMSDLNQKLGLGPPKEKKEEEPEVPAEPKVLEDARKSRAKGPQRRAPPKAAVAPATSEDQPISHSMSQHFSIWQIDDADGILNVHGHDGGLNAKNQEPVGEVEETRREAAPVENAEEVSKPNISTEEPSPMAPHGLSTNTAGEDTDPTTETIPSKPMTSVPQKTLEQSTLSQKTTESSSVYSEHPLQKHEAHEGITGDGLSRRSTASDTSFTTAERAHTADSPEKKAVDEPIKLRDEQVNASTVSEDVVGSEKKDVVANATDSKDAEPKADPADVAAGADHPHEPMPEDDVSYKRLEEMAAQADGKSSSEDEGTRKIA